MVFTAYRGESQIKENWRSDIETYQWFHSSTLLVSGLPVHPCARTSIFPSQQLLSMYQNWEEGALQYCSYLYNLTIQVLLKIIFSIFQKQNKTKQTNKKKKTGFFWYWEFSLNLPMTLDSIDILTVMDSRMVLEWFFFFFIYISSPKFCNFLL